MHGLSSKWSYLSQTTPNINHLLEPLEHSIGTTLRPKLTGQDLPNETQRCLFSLSAHLGDLNIVDPSSFAHDQFMASEQMTRPLVLSNNSAYPYETLVQNTIKTRRRQQTLDTAEKIRESLSPSMQVAMDLAQEKVASSWLTALPLEEYLPEWSVSSSMYIYSDQLVTYMRTT